MMTTFSVDYSAVRLVNNNIMLSNMVIMPEIK